VAAAWVAGWVVKDQIEEIAVPGVCLYVGIDGKKEIPGREEIEVQMKGLATRKPKIV
jgi:hypothetical protein